MWLFWITEIFGHAGGEDYPPRDAWVEPMSLGYNILRALRAVIGYNTDRVYRSLLAGMQPVQ